jgi:hypothetical protein
MNHEPEFHKPPVRNAQTSRELAACYARVFLGDEDGKRVLADLRAKFGLERLVFTRGENGRYDTLAAALVEGERRVMSEIENASRAGSINPNP